MSRYPRAPFPHGCSRPVLRPEKYGHFIQITMTYGTCQQKVKEFKMQQLMHDKVELQILRKTPPKKPHSNGRMAKREVYGSHNQQPIQVHLALVLFSQCVG